MGLLDKLLSALGMASRETRAKEALEYGDYDAAIRLYEKAGLMRRAAECELRRMEAEGPDWVPSAIEACNRGRFGEGVRQALMFDLTHRRSSWCFEAEHVRLLDRYGELRDFVEWVEVVLRRSNATTVLLRMHVAGVLAEAGEEYDAISLFMAAARLGGDLRDDCLGKALDLCYAVGDSKLASECAVPLLRGREFHPMEVAKLRGLRVLRPVVERVLPAYADRIQEMLYWFLQVVDPKFPTVEFSEAEKEELGGVSTDFASYEDVMDLLVTVHEANPDWSHYPEGSRGVDCLFDRIWCRQKAERVRNLLGLNDRDQA